MATDSPNVLPPHLEPFTPPLHLESLRRFVVAHAIPGVESHDAAGGCTRTVPAPSGTARVRVDLGRTHGDALAVRYQLADPSDETVVRQRVRDWLGLDGDPIAPDRVLGADPVLGADVAARPGLRVPGAVDPVEAALLTVLGQQVSMAAARTFAGRLVTATAVPGAAPGFPTATAVAALSADGIRSAVGVTGARARALHALASDLAVGPALRRTTDRAELDQTRARLMALPGVGPWTADLVALRVLGDPDVFLPGDLVARRAMGAVDARVAAVESARWRPFRSHALLHLWTRAVFVGP